MQTCTTPKLPALTAGKGCSEGTSAGAGLCQKLHACLPPSFTVSCKAEYAHAQLSRVYLSSTCDITHVITYTRPSSLLFYFWVRGEDEATTSHNHQQVLKGICIPFELTLDQHMSRWLQYSIMFVCLSLAGSWRRHHHDTQNKHQCQANYALFIFKKLISVLVVVALRVCHTGFEATALF